MARRLSGRGRRTDPRGEISGLVQRQNGRDFILTRMDDGTEQRLVQELKTKLQQQTATGGSESLFGQLIQGVAGGVPNYSGLSPGLAQATGEGLPELQHTLAALGPLASLKFMGADPQSGDIYHARFERGFDKWHLVLAPDGRIASAAVRPSP